MKKKSLQISIPEPCNQKFKDMTPTEGGRHCAQCNKVLVDFSVLTDKEIVEVVKNNKGKLCGHFRKSQLNRDISLVPQRVNSTRGKAASLLLTSMLSGGILEAQSKLLFPQSIENQEVVENKKTLVDDFLEKEKEKKIRISGTVMDETGEALIGASITLKGNTGIGTATDIDGNFQLTIKKELVQNGYTLFFSYTGYSTVEKQFTLEEFQNKINIIMEEGEVLTGDIVICGGYSYSESEYIMYEPKGFLHDWVDFFKKKKQQRKEKRENRKLEEVKQKEKIQSANPKIIFGKVTDETGEELIGANVLLKGTAIGTATNINGNFELNIPAKIEKSNPEIEVSYTGYISKIDFNLDDFKEKETLVMKLNHSESFIECYIRTTISDTSTPHWTPEGNWLLDIEKGIKKLAQKFRTKRNAKKHQKQLSESSKTIPSKETTKILKTPTLSYSTKINTIFPNPFLTEINVDFYSEKNNELEITVSDVSGRVVYLSNENILLGDNQIKINISKTSLQNGTYYLRIKDIDGYVQTRTLVRVIN